MSQIIDLESMVSSEWFTNDSPFRANYTRKNPKVCIITGGNAKGKSLLRKLLYNEYIDNKIEYMHISQSRRCRAGMDRMLVYGSEEEDSTGYNSVRTILKLIQTAVSREASYGIMIDEPEIGCSEELQAGIGMRLCRELPTWTKLECCYIITHSREVVRNLLALNPSHVHLRGNDHDHISLADWCNRKIQPVDPLERVIEEGRNGWKYVQSVINKRKQK